MDTYCYTYLCVHVDVRACVCACVQQEVMEHRQRASVPSCLFPSAPTFRVSKYTQPKLYVSELSQSSKNDHSVFSVGKGIVVSHRAFQCDDTEASFEVLGFPSSLTFTPSSCPFFPAGGGGGFAIPAVLFFFYFFKKVSPQTEVYFQGLSQ